MVGSQWKQEAHGSHRSPEKPDQINKHIWAELWLYHKLIRRRKTFSFLRIEWSLFVKHQITFTQGCFMTILVGSKEDFKLG